jgi:signal transduction histidine kinase
VRRMRVLVVSTVSAPVTVAAALFSQLNAAYRTSEMRIASLTVALLIALLTGFLVVGLRWARETWSSWHAWPAAAAMEERRRIACDLHDGLAQELAYLLRNLRSLDGTIDRETMARLQQAVERAQLETRLVISRLAAPHRQPVDAAVAHSVGEVAARGHIRLELDVGSDIELPPPRAEALVRIACEAVGNAAHHSGAEQVSLSLRRDGPHVRLHVRDGGSGFDPSVAATGFGLISMRERASSVGGDLRISTVPGQGTEVEATL